MELIKEKVQDERYEITTSGTFKIDSRKLILSKKVQALLKELKPVHAH